MTVRRRAGGTVAAALAVTAMLPVSTLAASESGEGQHCVLFVNGQNPDGELLTDEPQCFGTLSEALVAAGVSLDSQRSVISMAEVTSEQLMAAASGILAVHYDGADRTGASITISGSTCGGGWLNFSSAWTNRISSTLNGCNDTRFYDGYGLTGSVEGTGTATVNLKALNDAANSVQYSS